MQFYDGVINIYKEKGFTSHDVVNIVRGNLNRIKTGHTGTLDPNAEGVLPICIGKATKISEYIASDNKEYIAELILGKTTNTLDITGEVLEEKEVKLDFLEIEKIILSFKGEYFQTPPMFSAIKINGKKLYNLARKGIEVERKSRKISIFDISILGHNNNAFEIKVKCSKGTYIRSLCDDIGKKLGCGAVMGELTRTKTGIFSIKDSIYIEDFKKIVKENKINDYILRMEDILLNYKKVKVDSTMNKYLYNGNKISLDYVTDFFDFDIEDKQNVLVFDNEENLMGIYEVLKKDGFIKPIKMLL